MTTYIVPPLKPEHLEALETILQHYAQSCPDVTVTMSVASEALRELTRSRSVTLEPVPEVTELPSGQCIPDDHPHVDGTFPTLRPLLVQNVPVYLPPLEDELQQPSCAKMRVVYNGVELLVLLKGFTATADRIRMVVLVTRAMEDVLVAHCERLEVHSDADVVVMESPVRTESRYVQCGVTVARVVTYTKAG